uniref:Mucin 1, cell surface associated n=1 Tax=Panthera tigris altaica TaxID=74533 RepID=A0A8C9KNU7_PANTA
DLSPQPLTLITAAQDTAGTSATNHSVEPVTSSNHKTSPQLSIRISFFFLSFSISNLQFNSCLEDPNTGYYQELQRNVSEWVIRDASFPSAAGSGSGVPGWGIALLVLVCVLLALAVVYLVVLTVCQCRRKNCGQLDLFPPRDAYHPMSEYPTYHTHGRYIPPGSTRRSPYEEVSAGNGGGGRSSPTP